MDDDKKHGLSTIYAAFVCKNIEELDVLFRAEDQRLMNTFLWDYANVELVTNKIFRTLENINLASVDSSDECYWVQHILWSWYHHATGCAL